MYIKLSGLVLFSFMVTVMAELYRISEPTVEILHPRGFRVSIPDSPGIQLFSFHGAVNREINSNEPGDITADITQANNGKWEYTNNVIKLNNGNTLNYWIFVQQNGGGHRLNSLSFTAPASKRNSAGKTSSAQGRSPPSVPSSTPTAVTEPPYDLGVWRYLLTNLSAEVVECRSNVDTLKQTNEYLVNKLKRLDSENINKLILSGRIPRADDPLEIVKLVLKEKLDIHDTSTIQSAVRVAERKIIFEMSTFNEKLSVLQLAKAKLEGSRFVISDTDS